MTFQTFIPNFSKYSFEVYQSHTLAMNAFKLIKSLCPDSILAGGATRDWYVGRIPSDYDIYIKSNSNLNYSNGRLINLIREHLKIRCAQISDSYDVYEFEIKGNSKNGYSKPFLDRVYQIDYRIYSKFSSYEDLVFNHKDLYCYGSIQIMFVNDLIDLSQPMSLLNSFCCNLSRSYYDGVQVYYDESFKRGFDNNILSFTSETPPAYRKKLLRKFSDFTLEGTS